LNLSFAFSSEVEGFIVGSVLGHTLVYRGGGDFSHLWFANCPQPVAPLAEPPVQFPGAITLGADIIRFDRRRRGGLAFLRIGKFWSGHNFIHKVVFVPL
jgi:hypothetical protein